MAGRGQGIQPLTAGAANSEAGRALVLAENVPPPLIAIEPSGAPSWLAEAVGQGGGVLAMSNQATGIVWYGNDAGELRQVLAEAPNVRWVQLKSAGVERYRGLLGDGRMWTCAKAIYGEAVAEHALALILASFREIPRLARERRWTESVGASLYDARVTIVGAGGIASALLALMKPFRVSATVVRRQSLPVAGVVRVFQRDRLSEAIEGADVVVLACALVVDTVGLFGASQFETMANHALLVNVGRGQLVRTEELARALRSGQIAAAALDVTDPEPLPAGHILWELDNVLITPHSGNPDERGRQPLARLIAENVRRFAAKLPLQGHIDVDRGY
jgi:phosphoglycerate dehydrogenase-like enzyme